MQAQRSSNSQQQQYQPPNDQDLAQEALKQLQQEDAQSYRLMSAAARQEYAKQQVQAVRRHVKNLLTTSDKSEPEAYQEAIRGVIYLLEPS